MTITPEIEPQKPQPTPEAPATQAEPPKEVPSPQEHGTPQSPPQVVTQVAASDAQQPAQAPSLQVVTITVPATTQQLDDWSKGSPDNSLTWLAFYWIRMIKKALFHGYRVITQGSQQAQYA